MAATFTVEYLPDARLSAVLFRRDGDIDGALKRRAEKVAAAARVNAPVASGRLRASIKTKRPRDARGRFSLGYEVIADTPYSLYVHDGRRAGARMPPHAPIATWAAIKGIPQDRVFVIRRAIGRRGIKPKPFLLDALRRVGV